MQILFQGLIDDFGLTIGLRMVTRTHAKLGSLQLKESAPKTANEDVVSIANYGGWHPIEVYHMIHKSFGNGQCSKWIE